MPALFKLFFVSLAFVVNAQVGLQGKFRQSRQVGFIENKGQIYDQNHKTREDVLFWGNSGEVAFFLRNSGVSFQFSRVDSWVEKKSFSLTHSRRLPEQITVYRLDANWVNARKKLTFETDAAFPGTENFYDAVSSKVSLNVRTYSGVFLKDVFENIDVHFFSEGERLKYDFLVKPYADYSKIKTVISGASKIYIDERGCLIICTPLGNLQEDAPIVFQNNRVLTSSWKISGDTIGFNIEGYDPSLPLIIDPVVREWSTYYGGAGSDTPGSIRTDLSGNVYFAGTTSSSVSIATTGAHQTIFAGGINSTGDAYLVKVNSAGVRQWATYYGGYGTESSGSCAIDSLGNVYLTGYSNTGYSTPAGTVIATSGAFISTYTTGTNGFLAKFDSTGVRLWGTYCYGNPVACTVDRNGDVYIAGEFIASPSSIAGFIPTQGCHQPVYGGLQDGFITKFDSNGSRIWGTYYGGSGSEVLTSITTDLNNNVFVSGHGWSNQGTVIATPGSHQFAYGGFNSDGFLVKFNAAGTRLWGTYYGASDNDYAWSCCTDPAGNVFLAGTQVSFTFPYSGTLIATPGSYQSAFGGGSSDAYLAKFNSAGVRQWATYYGGNLYDEGVSCTADRFGNVYLTGITSSPSGISSVGSYQVNFGGGSVDAYVAKFDNNGTRIWGTYYGDTGDESARSSVTDISDALFIDGPVTSTANIASFGSHQSSFGGGSNDAFVAKFKECFVPDSPVDVTPSSNKTICQGNVTTLLSQSNGNITWYTSSTSSAAIGMGASFTTPTLAAGVYTYFAESRLCNDSVNPNRISITFTVSSNIAPIISVNSGSICSGQSFTIVPSGASTYTIQGGNNIVSPFFTTPYTVSGTSSAGCVSASFATCTVSVSPSPTIVASGGSLCRGSSFTIIPSGASNYSITGNNFVVSPLSSTVYSITGTGGTGCLATNTAVVNLTVLPTPTLSVTGGSICPGNMFTIGYNYTVTGNVSYINIPGNTFIVYPLVSTSYFITLIDGVTSCSVGAVADVSVFSQPTVSLNSGTVCFGESFTISPFGANSYTISGGNFVVSPSAQTVYTVTGASLAGCISSPVTCTVTVLPPVLFSVNSGSICSGEVFTITPSPAGNYTFSGGSATVAPIATTTYSVLGSNLNAPGCISQPVSSTVTVHPNPTVSVSNGTVCEGQSFVMLPSGASSYSYSSGSALVYPGVTSVYLISGTSPEGCVSAMSASCEVTVLQTPSLSVLNSPSLICAGESASLIAAGASYFSIHGYSFNPLVVITPTITTQYTVTGTSENGCVDSEIITQIVELCDDIDEHEDVDFKMYPNPSIGKLCLETASPARIFIYDCRGHMLMTESIGIGKTELSLFSYNSGIYFVHWSCKSKSGTEKLVIE